MTAPSNGCIELVCVPDAIAPHERRTHFALIRQLFGELVEERAGLADGYAYRFGPDVLETVVQFVANERKCCPFLSFELTVAGSGPLWLRVTGPTGTRAVLDAELAVSGTSVSETRSKGLSAER